MCGSELQGLCLGAQQTCGDCCSMLVTTAFMHLSVRIILGCLITAGRLVGDLLPVLPC